MTQQTIQKSNYITYLKEIEDTKTLIDQIKEAILPPDLIIVNCFPEYASRIVQMVNHKLSYLNDNELFETLDLQMPYPTMSQVWNDGEYQIFDKYVSDWVRTKIKTNHHYLFIGAHTLDGKNFVKLRTFLRSKLLPEDFKFACLYTQEDSIFTPNYYVEKLENRPLFEWENVDNPNWNN